MIKGHKVNTDIGSRFDSMRKEDWYENSLGRFPSNFIYTGCDEVLEEFEKTGRSMTISRFFQDINNIKINENNMNEKSLILGDCVEELKKIPDNSIDSCVTDPPAGISFMGKEWDNNKGGRDEWIRWMEEVMTEVYRVLKPGGHCFVWALPRTSHWTATALEDAGFEIRDCVYHTFGSGFPKSLNVWKKIQPEIEKELEKSGIKNIEWK